MRSWLASRGWIPSLILSIAIPSAPALAREDGIDSFFQEDGAGTCGGTTTGLLCHGTASSEVSVTITGPDTLAPDETAGYTIEIFETVQGGLQVGAGLNVHAYIDQVLSDIDDGVLAENLDNAQITITDGIQFVNSGQVTHVNAPGMGSDGSRGVFSYDFSVTAPSDPGTLELRGAMNSFNDSGDQFGDKWNNTALFVTVPEPAGLALAAASLLAVGWLRRRAAR